ncbi:MAG: hypothetical protein P8074_12185 [Anaerolineales bacterium]
MKLRIYFLLFLLGILMASCVSLFQHAPGYMDADYYYAGGLSLARQEGFVEPFLWNYLDDPTGLPHPSHAYWMPLASILAAAGMALVGNFEFSSARLAFILIAGWVPVFTAGLSYSLTRQPRNSLISGLLAVCAVFYLSYLPTTDTFGIYMLLGAAWFIVAGGLFDPQRSSVRLPGSPWRWLLLGSLSAGMHLARADGLFWLLLSLLAVAFFGVKESRAMGAAARKRNWLRAASPAGLVICGYLLFMGPWMLRNYRVFGALLSPGGGHALWVTSYDQLYAYPASLLSAHNWLQSGLQTILAARLQALGQNLQTALVVQGEIFLLPLVLWAAWKLRNDWRVRLAGIAWGITLFVMTFVFPYQGWRGGFFHSGAALQPMIWALAPIGLDELIAWGRRQRGWQPNQASRVFQMGLLVLAVFMTLLVVPARVIGDGDSQAGWNESAYRYAQIDLALGDLGAGKNAVVMVNNPPGYFIASGRGAIPVPDGDVATLQAVAQRYQAGYLLVEANHTHFLNSLYQEPADFPGFDYLTTVEDTHIFAVRKSLSMDED